MSTSSRSMNFSALAVGIVLFLIAQVTCQAGWTAVCENGQTVAWLNPNRNLVPVGGGTPSGSGECSLSYNPPIFNILTAPTAFNFPIAGRTLRCATNNVCPAAAPAQPASPSTAICDGGRIVAWLNSNRQLLPPSGAVAPSGGGQCSRRSGGPYDFHTYFEPLDFHIFLHRPVDLWHWWSMLN
ncbi:secreted protein [Melampsora americana]|nr:secreted protein [Melampsora americana]